MAILKMEGVQTALLWPAPRSLRERLVGRQFPGQRNQHMKPRNCGCSSRSAWQGVGCLQWGNEAASSQPAAPEQRVVYLIP